MPSVLAELCKTDLLLQTRPVPLQPQICFSAAASMGGTIVAAKALFFVCFVVVVVVVFGGRCKIAYQLQTSLSICGSDRQR